MYPSGDPLGAPAALAHDRSLGGAASGEPGAQRVSGQTDRVDPRLPATALNDAGDARGGEAAGAELPVTVDGPEEGAVGDPGNGEPCAQRADRAGVRMLVEGDAAVLSSSFLVGLAPAEVEPVAGLVVEEPQSCGELGSSNLAGSVGVGSAAVGSLDP